ncbi:MarR family transcriptional regulator [Paenibacillus filicis]|uniref:MarR family transcriptional regulator n=1 Tax=Paenibacillus filicis TaxID=669464 RepID=A0ABU9DQ40_9BACL
MSEIDKRLMDLDELLVIVVRHARKWAASSGLSRQQMVLLHTLFVNNGATVGELAEELELSASATTLSVNRLEQMGLVVRQRDGTDRRVVRLQLSESAKGLTAEMWSCKREILKQLMGGLDSQEQEQFVRLLRKMTSSLGGNGE